MKKESFYITEIVRSLDNQRERWTVDDKDIIRDDKLCIFYSDNNCYISNPVLEIKSDSLRKELAHACSRFQHSIIIKIYDSLIEEPQRWRVNYNEYIRDDGVVLFSNSSDTYVLKLYSKDTDNLLSRPNPYGTLKSSKLYPIKKYRESLYYGIKKFKIWQEQEAHKKRLSDLDQYFHKETRREKIEGINKRSKLGFLYIQIKKMEIRFFNLFVGKRNVWGFSLFNVSAADGTGDVSRSFVEAKYDFDKKKWSLMLFWYQIL